MYKKYVYVSQEVRNRIQSETKMSDGGLWKALNFESNGRQSVLVRELAISYGGEVRYDIPECETIHDADGRMIQTFSNGAVIICDKATGDMRVEYKGKIISTFPDARLSTLKAAQALASQL